MRPVIYGFRGHLVTPFSGRVSVHFQAARMPELSLIKSPRFECSISFANDFIMKFQVPTCGGLLRGPCLVEELL